MERTCRIAAAAIVCLALYPGVPHAGDTKTEKKKAEAADAVSFGVKIISGGTRWGPAETTWRMSYTKDKKTATFRITLPHKALGKGSFSRDDKKTGATVLLEDLATALRGKVPDTVDQVDELPVTFYVLGDKMSRTKTGSFKAEPAGDWLAVKIFVAKDRGEFYLNINEREGKGEIRMKGPDQGEAVMNELAKVLAPLDSE